MWLNLPAQILKFRFFSSQTFLIHLNFQILNMIHKIIKFLDYSIKLCTTIIQFLNPVIQNSLLNNPHAFLQICHRCKNPQIQANAIYHKQQKNNCCKNCDFTFNCWQLFLQRLFGYLLYQIKVGKFTDSACVIPAVFQFICVHISAERQPGILITERNHYLSVFITKQILFL